MATDVPELARAARLRRSKVTLEALWTRVLNLRTWFVPVETGAGGAIAPVVVEREGRRSVLLFTDELGAVQYQVLHRMGGLGADATPLTSGGTTEQACMPEAGEAPASKPTAGPCEAGLELELPVVARLLSRLMGEGVYSAIFDIDEEPFEVPLSTLAPLCAGPGPVALAGLLEATVLPGPDGRVDFRTLFELAAQDGSARERALEAVMGLEDWWFICNPREPDAIFVRRVEGCPTLMAFTSQRGAIRATQEMGVVDPEGMILLLQLPVAEAVEWLAAFPTEGVQAVAFDSPRQGLRSSVEELRRRWAMREETA